MPTPTRIPPPGKENLLISQNSVHLHHIAEADLIGYAMAGWNYAPTTIDILRDMLTGAQSCDLDDRGRCRAHQWTHPTVGCPYARGRDLLRRIPEYTS